MALPINYQKVNTDQEVDISVIVAVFNVEKFLPQCLESLRNQTLESAEFLIIDDGSTDSSGSICDQFQQIDKRFKVLHQPNKGSFLARKQGIELACGRWSIFVDGDDYLPSDDVLETELELAEKNNVDMLRFDVEIIAESAEKKKGFLRWMGDFKGEVHSSHEIVSKIFGPERTISWNLWDKVYRTSVLKKTVPFMQREDYIPCATDVLQMFLTCFYGTTLYSISTKPLYCYRHGVGISTGEVTLGKFENYAREVKLIESLNSFLSGQNKLEEYGSILEAIEQRLIRNTINRYSRMDQKDSKKGFDLLVDNNQIEYVTENLRSMYKNRVTELADKVRNSSCLQYEPGEGKNVAIYCPHISDKRVARAILQQMSSIASLGYHVVLITDEESGQAAVPKDVRLIILPAEYSQGRAFALSEAIRGHKLDTIIYQIVGNDQNLLFDIIQIKALKRKVVIFQDEPTTLPLIRSFTDFGSKPHIYCLADALAVTNFMELNFYKRYGIPTYYIPVPVTSDCRNLDETTIPKDRKFVLWNGKLENGADNFKEALDILAEVVRSTSNVGCLMIGEGTPENENFVVSYIRKNKLEDRIKFFGTGQGTETEKYYSTADVQLITTNFDPFGEAISASKQYGIPLVLYEMPYMEILSDKKGYISVPRHSKEAATTAIIGLLTDDAKRIKMGKDARQSGQDFVKRFGEQKNYWEALLLNLEKPNVKIDSKIIEEQRDSNLLFWDTAFSFYKEGISQKNKELSHIKQEREKDSKEKLRILHEKECLEQDAKRLETGRKVLTKEKEVLTKEKEKLADKNEKLTKEKEKLIDENEKLKQASVLVNKKLAACLARETALKNSLSFRVGRSITWLPRKIRDAKTSLTNKTSRGS